MTTLTQTQLSQPFEKIHTGKVRDSYMYNNQRIILVTDRQSAFDESVGAVPCKGQALNQISAWWFNKTQDIVPNHIIDIPDQNVMLVKNAKMFPVEVVVRGYITGSTDTSAWVNYQKGVKNFCGNTLPEGLKKNQKFDSPIITPTTKPDTGPDMPISAEEIISQGLVEKEKWEKICDYALKLYKRGVELAAQRGLIFVDTKYEFGEDEEGNIIVCDEVNTPDSSRYWIMDSYDERFDQGQEPQSLDKEFLRLYLKEKGYGKENIQDVPEEIFSSLSEKYIELYERVTGETFVSSGEGEDIIKRVEGNLLDYFKL
ncbi:phosphoribosylaminoimidazolesuccinocarboxamide synthase [Candidatus Peregrinibacteria bacterium]|jgi:phosphoribosylaminoimidazole-succinocarboxamide synthase|nr:phosphoribosylaminoimidazolesuccinocarboxamide synthase [Candidatus Peregrinibacteria bacterium]